MRIRHNIPAKNAYRSYRGNAKALQSNLQKLSSGYAINKAADDAAGLAVSEKMRMQITGLEQAERNAKDGISLLNTAEGALAELHVMLNRAFSLAEQSANGTYDDDTDRVQLQSELDSLRTEIDRIAQGTNFNGIELLHTDGHAPSVTNATALTGSETTINSGWYIVSGNVTFNSTLTINGNVHLILADGCTMKSENGGVDVSAGNSLTIYAQSDGANMGKIIAKGTDGHAGIGSDRSVDSGAITINGGWVDATGGIHIDIIGGTNYVYGGAGIGGGSSGAGDVTINGGAVTATGGLGAGIGGGHGGAGKVTINGGTVTAISGDGGAGIGGGNFGVGDVTINGGTVTATGGDCDAGIGGGLDGVGKVTINGGTVTATGGDAGGAGIGGGRDGSNTVTISGGTVTATGGACGAGIGGGERGNGEVTISGGTVTATGGDGWNIWDEGGAGIGGGAGGGTVIVEISGGTVTATGGEKSAGIGGGCQGVGDVTITSGIGIVSAKGGTGGEHIGNGAQTTSSATVNIDSTLTDKMEGGYRKLYGNGTPPTNPNTPDENTIRLRIGVESFEILDINKRDMCCVSLGIANISIAHQDDASDAMDPIKEAINRVSDYRGYLGALGNRLEHTINNLNNMRENITDAESTIRDTDVAEEMMKYTKNNILVQSSQAMLAQANQLPQGVLQLLG